MYSTYRQGTEADMLCKEANKLSDDIEQFVSTACDTVETLEGELEEKETDAEDMEAEIGKLKEKIALLEEAKPDEKISLALINLALYVNETLRTTGVWEEYIARSKGILKDEEGEK